MQKKNLELKPEPELWEPPLSHSPKFNKKAKALMIEKDVRYDEKQLPSIHQYQSQAQPVPKGSFFEKQQSKKPPQIPSASKQPPKNHHPNFLVSTDLNEDLKDMPMPNSVI